MDKQVVTAIFFAVLLLSASCSPLTTPANTTFQNLPSNITIPHNNRFVWLLAAPAFTALAEALMAAAAGTAAVVAGVGTGLAIKDIVDSSGHSGGSGDSSGGSPDPPSYTRNYETLAQRVQTLASQIEQTLVFSSTTYTALKLFDPCDLNALCLGSSPGIFGIKLYLGLLVPKGTCPVFKADEHGKVVAAGLNAINPLTTKAMFQIPPSGICNKECCMVKKNLAPGIICFEKATAREGRCTPDCSNTEELGDSVGCDKGFKCCGQHHRILL